MINIASEQIIELLYLLMFAFLYLVSVKLINIFAVVLSGKKYGILRQVLSGIIFVIFYVASVMFSNNGNFKLYSVIVYIVLVFLLTKSYSFTGNIVKKIKRKRGERFEG